MIIAVIGGGAAGFFAALTAKEANPDSQVIILERTAKYLSKVRISGGGRCNVTHACFDPRQLTQNYPRGSKELLGPFHRFQPSDTIDWFAHRGVTLKEEADGRMFPETDSSETVINCLLREADRLGVELRPQSRLTAITQQEQGFALNFKGQAPLHADAVILATGSAKAGWDFAEELGHRIQDPVPSLFTFNVPNFELEDLAGVSVEKAELSIEGSKFKQLGPLLITHWGFSGPAALKLSAFAARYLAEKQYRVGLTVDWIPDLSVDELRQRLAAESQRHPKKQLHSLRCFPLPKSLWRRFCDSKTPLACLSKAEIAKLCERLKGDSYQVAGKTTNKDEFVTCGGVTLSEVQFKTMESKLCPNLFFCGEVLDIDGVTGGFNFQNAWTTGWIAGRAAAG